MRSLSRIIVIALATLVALPASAAAQIVEREPIPPMPCPGCWWPVEQVAQLDRAFVDPQLGHASRDGRRGTARDHGEPDAGRRLAGWFTASGLSDLQVTTSTWTYSTVPEIDA